MANYPPVYYPYGQPQSMPMQMQSMPMQTNPQDAFLCRPVTCREEAVGTPTDFTRPMLFPDISHGMIYLKRFNPNTGSSDILDFKQVMPNEVIPEQNYVTRQEFDSFCADLLRRITKSAGEVAPGNE